MKRLAAFMLALGVLTACGGSTESDVPTVGGGQETIAETIEEQPMDEVEVIEEPSTGDEAMSFSNVPDDWPADLPVPEGGMLQAWTNPSDKQVFATWAFENADLMDVGSAYDEALRTLEVDFAESLFDTSEYASDPSGGKGSYANAERTFTFDVRSGDSGNVEIYAEHTYLQ